MPRHSAQLCNDGMLKRASLHMHMPQGTALAPTLPHAGPSTHRSDAGYYRHAQLHLLLAIRRIERTWLLLHGHTSCSVGLHVQACAGMGTMQLSQTPHRQLHSPGPAAVQKAFLLLIISCTWCVGPQTCSVPVEQRGVWVSVRATGLDRHGAR